MKVFAAVDLGASSGRAVAGAFDGQRIELQPIHRFSNGGIVANGRTHWDVLALWSNILEGLRAAGTRYGDQLVSVGVDTWGVDFGLLDKQGHLLGNPLHYRDRHTSGILEQAFEVVSRDEIFRQTGLQFLEFNTLYQLFALKQAGSVQLEMADRLLMMPDLFHYWMTGEAVNEYTDVSTTQMIDPESTQWSRPLLEKFGIPTSMLGTIVPPGTRLGSLRPDVAEATGQDSLEVVLPGTHDTASAVLAVPAQGTQPDWCYISSGTWSLMGVEVNQPVVSDRCRQLNFTNEGGVNGTVRLLKNIAGLWLIQECRRIWQLEGSEYSWEQLVEMAEGSDPLACWVDPDDGRFIAPAHMPDEIRSFCRETGQAVPDSPGAVVRSALESLALRYRQVVHWLEELTGNTINTIHIVGGGVQNQLLNQMAADACNKRVVTGPVEATALGNVLMQAIAMGELESIQEARQIVRNSFDVQSYEPKEPGRWEDAYRRFTKLGQPR